MPPARPFRSIQTGQNSSVPENSLPQLGQVRLVCVLIVLDVLQRQPQPTAKPPAHRVVRNRPARPLANCCHVPQAVARSFILARQIMFRNKIPAAFGDGASCKCAVYGLNGRRAHFVIALSERHDTCAFTPCLRAEICFYRSREKGLGELTNQVLAR